TLARYHRLRGARVLLATGTDENAPKVAQAAADEGLPSLTFVDRMAARFRSTWDELGVHYDDFVRTTEPRHVHAAQALFRTLREHGDIYQGTYEGWYCQPDETHFAEEEVIREP